MVRAQDQAMASEKPGRECLVRRCMRASNKRSVADQLTGALARERVVRHSGIGKARCGEGGHPGGVRPGEVGVSGYTPPGGGRQYWESMGGSAEVVHSQNQW